MGVGGVPMMTAGPQTNKHKHVCFYFILNKIKLKQKQHAPETVPPHGVVPEEHPHDRVEDEAHQARAQHLFICVWMYLCMCVYVCVYA